MIIEVPTPYRSSEVSYARFAIIADLVRVRRTGCHRARSRCWAARCVDRSAGSSRPSRRPAPVDRGGDRSGLCRGGRAAGYSEAWFKTLKYAPVFPDRFASLGQARTFMNDFVTWYNYAHRHSGIGLHTSADVHHGRHHTVRAGREDTIAAARMAHPERFGTTRPVPKILDLPKQVWINKPEPH
ncbi:integrase core domain-containing protein [Micromonospora sp. SCSIO 07396]